MKRSRLSCILITMTCSIIGTRLSTSGGDSNSPRYHSSVALEFSLPGDRIEASVPIVAHVTLSNCGNEPMTIRTREEGTPAGISLVRVSEDGETQKMPLWLRRSGPRTHDVTLASDEHISGEVLLFDRVKGFPFAVQGKYGVSICWTSSDGSEKACSDQLEVDVLPPREQNTTFLMELQDLAIDYYADGAATKGRVDPAELDEARILFGNKLLAKVIAQRRPLRGHANGASPDLRIDVLAERLEGLLSRHATSPYSAYIARFLGLLHLHTVMDRFSLERHEVLEKAKHPSQWDGTACRANPSYQKARKYLTEAYDSEIWPRSTASEHLGLLYIVAQEWGKAEECLTKLRARDAERGGVQRADVLQRQMAKYKAKLASREAAAP